MRTLQPALKNGRYVWDRIHMPEAEFRHRVAVVRERMRRENIDVLLAYGCGFDSYADATYLSNHIARLPKSQMVLLDQNERLSMLFEGASRGIPSIRKITWIEDVVATGMDMSKTLPQYLKEHPLAGDTVGLAGARGHMPFDLHEALKKALQGKTLKEADGILEDCRQIKSPAELDQMRRAGRLVGRTMGSLAAFVPHGQTDRTLEAYLFRQARLEGAEDVRMLIGFPQESNWSLRPSENRPLGSGQTVIIYLAAAYERYWAEAAGTFVVGNEAMTHQDQVAGTRILEQLRQSLVPGQKTTEGYRKIMDLIEDSGQRFIHNYGLMHGIGLSIEEAPFFGETKSGELEPGMCFSLRLTFQDDQLGAVMTGDTLAMTDTGIEILTKR